MKVLPAMGRRLLLAVIVVGGLLGAIVISRGTSQPTAPAPSPATAPPVAQSPEIGRDEREQYAVRRAAMVRFQLRGRDIHDATVLAAMERVPRHRFVPAELVPQAYADRPLPIGHEQTISQPYIVALMTQLATPQRTSRALDIGTGSGYQAAVLAELVAEVYSIEIVPELARQAQQRLGGLGYENVTVRHGDGYRGWPDQAPFDLIIVAAAPDHVPQPLIEQLAPGGKLVIPVGDVWQELLLVEKLADGTTQERKVLPVRFVPMTGEATE